MSLAGERIRTQGNSPKLWYIVAKETPFGLVRGIVAGDEIGLASMKAEDEKEFLQGCRQRLGEEASFEKAPPGSRETLLFDDDVEGLLRGAVSRLRPDLRVNTSFQRRVAHAVLDIPFGDTASYGDIAAALGKPGGAQAVGQALPRLPFALFIPSHRVVRVSGESVGCTLLTHTLKTGLLRWEQEQRAMGH